MENTRGDKTIWLGYAASVFALVVVASSNLLWFSEYLPSALWNPLDTLTSLRGPLLPLMAIVLAVVLFLNRRGPFESLDRILALFLLVELIGHLLPLVSFLLLSPVTDTLNAPRPYTPVWEVILWSRGILYFGLLSVVIVAFWQHRAWVRGAVLTCIVLRVIVFSYTIPPNNPEFIEWSEEMSAKAEAQQMEAEKEATSSLTLRDGTIVQVGEVRFIFGRLERLFHWAVAGLALLYVFMIKPGRSGEAPICEAGPVVDA